MAEAQANYDAVVAGPTREERAIADAQVQAAAAAVTVLERRLDKMVLRAPLDGVVSVIAALRLRRGPQAGGLLIALWRYAETGIIPAGAEIRAETTVAA